MLYCRICDRALRFVTFDTANSDGEAARYYSWGPAVKRHSDFGHTSPLPSREMREKPYAFGFALIEILGRKGNVPPPHIFSSR